MNKISDDDLDLVNGGLQGYANGVTDKFETLSKLNKYSNLKNGAGKTIGIKDSKSEGNLVSDTPIGANPQSQFLNRTEGKVYTA